MKSNLKFINSAPLIFSLSIAIIISSILRLNFLLFIVLTIFLFLFFALLFRKKDHNSALTKSWLLKVFILLILCYKLLIFGINIKTKSIDEKWTVSELVMRHGKPLEKDSRIFKINLIHNLFISKKEKGVMNLKYRFISKDKVRIDNYSSPRGKDENPWLDNSELPPFIFSNNYNFKFKNDTLILFNDESSVKLVKRD
jgi:glucan phosphoethanolaminetransferase (alkaline phosphatase superfamily)